MHIKTIPHGPSIKAHWGSDVENLSFSSQGLNIRIALEIDAERRVRGLDVTFPDASAFRYLDELDLARYWMSKGFVRGHPVLEVQGGGWCDEEAVLQQFENHRREWLIATSNGCVSVLASSDPTIIEVAWDRDA